LNTGLFSVSYAEDAIMYFAERVHNIKGSDDSILRFLVAHSEVYDYRYGDLVTRIL